jgi:3'-phosphoadenosine 5'-phosphosulfate sulfotransferase (PAPS reductase)/FAD synthetase
MGINRTDGKATMETIPSEANRSQFSCERYQFFLDAPFEISNMCCSVMKKSIMKDYQKKTHRNPITAQMASESRLRTQVWLKQGCNAFDAKKPISNPMSFWFEQDILEYIYENHLPINPVYGDVVIDYEGMNQVDGQMSFADLGIFDLERPMFKTTGMRRTGCFACGYGMHHENCPEKSRIQMIIDYSNPKMADWMLRGGHFNDNGLWEPYQGLGYCFVIEWINKAGGFKMWYPNRVHYLSQLPDECWRYLE